MGTPNANAPQAQATPHSHASTTPATHAPAPACQT